ncbi:Ref family recombination enhancement nuclease [Pseudomonas sp.]|jgi:hypothetical protein|uniref:Ref family recombination enhancement nuclease n=1 Tax=Pseudomonas sp. TaxID=306 RepID=UPI002EDA6851
MKGTNPSARQKRYHDLLATHIGCQACFHDHGHRNTHVSIHHIEGRTKPDAHWMVLALCAGHHIDGQGAPGLIAVHPYKARFQKLYGHQMDLMRDAANDLQDLGCEIPDEVLDLIGVNA